MRTLERVEYHGRQGKPPDTAAYIVFPTMPMRSLNDLTSTGLPSPPNALSFKILLSKVEEYTMTRLS